MTPGGAASDVALLIIDVQVGLLSPVWRVEALLATLAEVIARARAAGVPVIYVQDDSVGAPGSPVWDVHAAIAPQPGELRVRKTACDSFHATPLAQELAARGIRRLVVAGCKSQYCIDSTCRRAITLGYALTLVADGHSTEDSPVLEAARIVAHENQTLSGFGVEGAEIAVVPARDLRF